ncbi:MAG: DNA-binding response regulator, partial [Actinomycetia bacterium]|nr:DNA-binding response regulator [Actinomycetes bacterium]
MLVEDDDRVAAALMDGLRRQSIEVVRASTGRAAMTEVGDGSGFDVILLDLGLPDQDGLSVCRQLREVADVPIIMVTARTDMRTRVHCCTWAPSTTSPSPSTCANCSRGSTPWCAAAARPWWRVPASPARPGRPRWASRSTGNGA